MSKYVFNQFLNSSIAKRKYQEFLKEESLEPDGLTEEDCSFSDWINDLIDEYGKFAFEIKMSDWKKENALYILDIKKLKITKVQPRNVYFVYDNISYFLHYSNEEDEQVVTLYKKLWNGNHYELVPLSSVYNVSYPKNVFIRKKEKIKKGGKTPLVYNQIDKEYFVKQLVSNELCFASTEIMLEVEENMNKIKEIEELISNLDKQKSFLQKELLKYKNFN